MKLHIDTIFRDVMIAANIGLFGAIATYKLLHLPKVTCFIVIGIVTVLTCISLRKEWVTK